MSSLEHLRLAGAAEQARAIVSGRIDSNALVTAEAAAIARLNPRLNAFVQVFSSKPGQTETAAESTPLFTESTPLFGTTFAVKDNFDVAGFATQAGLAALKAAPAERDATVISRLKSAGMVLTGKTSMSPMALGASTHNVDFGDCYNPLRTGYSAGGSSGGSASAVAAGLVGIALGSDTMGSVRIPAAMCGIVGFKPSRGELPVDGLLPLCKSLDHVGVLSRTIEDASLAFAIMRNGVTETQSREYDSKHSNQSSAKPCIGVLNAAAQLPLQSEVEVYYRNTCLQLQAQGFNLQPVSLEESNLSRVRRAGLLLCEAELLTTLQGVYPECRELLPPDLVSLLDYIQGQTSEKLEQAKARLALSKAIFESWFEHVDVVMLPTAPCTAFPMSGPIPADIADLTVIANILGAPAISLPVFAGAGRDQALPFAVQLIGQQGQDSELLLLADQLGSML